MLTRRLLLQSSAALSAAALLPGCGPDASVADGSLERPFTTADPGPWAEKVKIHQPVVYAGLIDDARVRVWVEVEDTAAGTTHEQTPDHFISRLRIEDQGGAVLADVAYPAEAAARLIVELELAASVTQLRVLEQCNKHGVWLATYEVADVKVEPAGDERRPLTKDQPGPWGEKIASHVPVLTKIDGGRVKVDVGDIVAGKLHVSEADHYIEDIVVYDQNGQELARVEIGPSLQPTFDFSPPPGTDSVRAVAWCNQHDHWEAVLVL